MSVRFYDKKSFLLLNISDNKNYCKNRRLPNAVCGNAANSSNRPLEI